MAKELQYPSAVTGQAVYAVIFNSVGQAWYTVTPAFEALNNAHWTSYAITLSEQSSTAVYEGDMPAAIPAGIYSMVAYKRAGASPAIGDAVVAVGQLDWSGSTVNALSSHNNSGQTANQPADVQTVKTQAVTCPAPVTVGAFVGNATHALVVDASGFVTASTVTDKTGYGLSPAERTTLTTVIHSDVTDPLGANVVAILAKVGPLPTSFPGNFAALAITSGGLVSMNLSQAGLVPRALDSVADAALTVGDGLVAAICAAAGKETVSGLAFTVSTPSTGSVIRNFTLDSATIPTRRS